MHGKVGIVGAGAVGASAAYLLALVPGIREIVLLDLDAERAKGEALDIGHAAAFGGNALIRAGDYDDLAGAQVVVITAGTGLEPGQTRLDLVGANVRIVASVLGPVLAAVPDAVLLFATNPVDVMPAVAVRRFGVPPGRAIGTGCALDTARLRDRLARHLGVGSGSVHANVLGEHGDSEVLHWSGAHVAGMPLVAFAEAIGQPLPPEVRAAITEEVRTAAFRIVEGKGVSNFGIGACIARLTRAIVNDEGAVLTVSTFMEEVLGVADTCISLPHVLGRQGASRSLLPALDDAERTALTRSAELLRTTIGRGLDILTGPGTGA